MDAPRVLVVCPRLPLPVIGGLDLRTIGIVKALARTSIVGVVSPFGEQSAAPPFTALWQCGGFASPDGPPVIRNLLENSDDPFAPFAPPEIVAFVRSAIDDFQPSVVVVTWSQMWRVAQDAMRGTGIPAIVDLDQSSARMAAALESVGGDDAAFRIQSRFNRAAARYEEQILEQPHSLWISSEVEADEMSRRTDRRRVSVVPNVVDLNLYSPAGVARVPRRVLFPASFGYLPNTRAAEEIVTGIAPLLPDHHFVLAGSNAPPWLREGRWPNVSVLGRVASMAEQLASASAVIVPLRAGTGTRLKIVEALASRTPVVSTAIGAEGLDLDPGRHYIQAESTADLAQAITQLDADPQRCAGLTREGYEFVREHLSVDSLAPHLARLIQGTLGTPAGNGSAVATR